MSESDDATKPVHPVEPGHAAAATEAPSNVSSIAPVSAAAPPSAVSGGPSVPPPLPAPAPEPDPAAVFVSAMPAQAPRPLLGPSLWVAGVLLWAYVVMGILTTTRLPFTAKRLPLSEGTAFALVIAAYASAGVLAVRRSLAIADGESGRRAGGIAAGAIGFWMSFVVGAMVLAALGFPEPLVTFMLILWSGFAVWLGRRLTNRAAPIVPDQNRVVTFALWIGAALVSVVALLARA
jgi:hypothetical protein